MVFAPIYVANSTLLFYVFPIWQGIRNSSIHESKIIDFQPQEYTGFKRVSFGQKLLCVYFKLTSFGGLGQFFPFGSAKEHSNITFRWVSFRIVVHHKHKKEKLYEKL
jgi:hypothetical protein